MLQSRGPRSLALCTLLDKPERRVVDVNVNYTGFQIPDEFVVGYGLDYDQRYRNLRLHRRSEILTNKERHFAEGGCCE